MPPRSENATPSQGRSFWIGLTVLTVLSMTVVLRSRGPAPVEAEVMFPDAVVDADGPVRAGAAMPESPAGAHNDAASGPAEGGRMAAHQKPGASEP